ncbi:MAG: HPr family phosphocarrier protein [Planctomycetota bacterium]
MSFDPRCCLATARRGGGGKGDYMQTGETVEKGFYEVEVQIKNTDGLHMRPAMQFVDIASQYKSSIKVSNEQTGADGKSIMQMSMLAALCGSRLKIRAEGADADGAVEALRELVEVKHFGEPTPEEKDRPSTTTPADGTSPANELSQANGLPGQAFEGKPPTTTFGGRQE